MGNILYLYTQEGLEDLKKDFSNREVISIGGVLSREPTLDQPDIVNFDDYIIDLTSLGFEFNYYRIFLETYLDRLTSSFSSAVFILNHLQLDAFKEKFPFIFDDIDTMYVKNKQLNLSENLDGVSIDRENVNLLPIWTYNQAGIGNSVEGDKVASIGRFFSGTNGVGYSLSIETIKTLLDGPIEYIDLTQLIDAVRIRSDLKLSFEIYLRQIFMVQNKIKFLVEDKRLKDLQENLPFVFRLEEDFLKKDEMPSSKEEIKFWGGYNVDEISREINLKLKGHYEFKNDFKFNLQKYSLLHELGERKIFSIFLTGESGIGKTEFAKMLSEIMYPFQKLIKINFGNYSTEGILNSLIGSPLGYVGSEEGGELINKIKTSKSKVILIDEFEKATPSIFHFFYELLEDGKFTDRHGEEHNLDGYIIVFTSNMTPQMYTDRVPDPLKSRFDMVYQFVDLPLEEKRRFASEVAHNLSDKIEQSKNVKLNMESIKEELEELVKSNNLRGIKRKVEDAVIREYEIVKKK